MCSKCYEEMEHLPIEQNRKISTINKDISVYCCGVYNDNLQKLIRGIKYHKQKELAYFQAKFMFEYWQKITNKNDFYYVIPVPLFKEREKKRKYNHMVLIAEEFCKLTGYELNLNLIVRIKDTKPQYRLNKAQRMENLANAFRVNIKEEVKGKILLIDDICTTGSTFENMIAELQKNSIDDIVCLATTTPLASEQ